MPPRAPSAEAKRLAALVSCGILGTPAEETFTRPVRLAQGLLGTTGALLSFAGEKRVYFKAHLGTAARSYPRQGAPCTYVTLSAEPWVAADLQSVPGAAELAFVKQNGVRFYAGVPVIVDGLAVGALSVFDRMPRGPTGSEMALLTDLAETVADLLSARRQRLEIGGLGAHAATPHLPAGNALLHLGELLEHGSYYALIARPDGSLLHANASLKAALGLGGLPGALRDLYPATTHAALAAALGNTLEAGQARLETVLLSHTGAQVPVVQEMMLHPRRREREAAVAPVISVVARDLSTEKQREAFEQHRSEVLELTARGAPLPAVLLRLTHFLETHCPGTIAAVSLLRGDTLQLEVAPQLPGGFVRVIDGLRIGPETGACGVAAYTGVRIISSDIRRDRHWQNLRYFALQNGLQASWSEPILSDQGGVLGTLALYARAVRAPSDGELRILREAAQLAAIAVSRRRLYEQLEHQAHYDALTGLPNRRLLAEHLARALRHAEHHDEHVGVFLLDLDNFKQVNDSLGHSAGDLLLSEVAGRLQGCLPPGASVARSGGDEFVFVAPLAHRDDAARFAFEITEALDPPFVIRGRTFRIEASVGISLFPDDAADRETLLKAADSAMHAAKADRRAGSRQGYRLYQSAMTDELEAQLKLEAELRGAFAGDELRLFVQPRFEIARGRFSAFEALVRWQHPEQGLLAPTAFLGTAQKAGLLPQLDAWVLRSVVAQLSCWGAAGKIERLSCNVSAASFQSGAFLTELGTCLEAHGSVAERLEIEITENLLMQDLEGAAVQLRKLKVQFPGVRVAIDDFGSGYSSLAYLRHLPVDTLKIDRAFVKDLDHSDTGLQRTALAVIRTVIALGRDLGFRVVAEGAETEAHLGMLTALGVDEVQGFVLGKPQPLTEVVVDMPFRVPGPSKQL